MRGERSASMRTPLARVRGLGAAREGTGDWLAERLTALILVPLSLWLVASVMAGVGADYASMTAWLSSSGNMTLMILLLVAGFWHAVLSLSVVIEDYVHHEAAKVASLIVVRLVCLLLGVFSTVAVLKIGLGG